MTKFCTNCGKEVNENAEFCTGCGINLKNGQFNTNNNKQNKKIPKWVIVILIVFGIFIIGSAFGSDIETENNSSYTNEKSNNEDSTNDVSSDNDSTNESDIKNNSSTKREKLTLEDGHYGYADDYGFAYYIEGYIKNNTNKKYSYIQVSFTTFDAEGNTIGSCLANNSGLQANGRWKFKAICSGDAETVARYEFDEITGW